MTLIQPNSFDSGVVWCDDMDGTFLTEIRPVSPASQLGEMLVMTYERKVLHRQLVWLSANTPEKAEQLASHWQWIVESVVDHPELRQL